MKALGLWIVPRTVRGCGAVGAIFKAGWSLLVLSGKQTFEMIDWESEAHKT